MSRENHIKSLLLKENYTRMCAILVFNARKVDISASAVFFQDLLKEWDERGDIFLNRLPDNGDGNSEIFMNHDIPDSTHFGPWCFGIPIG